MQDSLIIKDAALSARLLACRQLFLRLDAGTAGEQQARLPEGGAASPGMRPGAGLRASGALLAYALLGREDADAEAKMEKLGQEEPDRQIRRVCQMAAEMLREDPAFSQASLYACLRTAAVFLPESQAAAELPGLISSAVNGGKTDQPSNRIAARFAWAGNAAIAYFDLPEGVSEACVAGKTCTHDMCRAGVCLPPECAEETVTWEGGSALLTPCDPLAGLKLTVGFRIGRIFVPARRTPRSLWGRLQPWLRIQGPVGGKTPEMTLVTSCGKRLESAGFLPQGVCYLHCPRLSPDQDDFVEIRTPGLRYLDLTGEG